MSERIFKMCLTCRYQAPLNSIAELSVEHMQDGSWSAFDLDLLSPGFDIFVYSMLTCQHLYFRTNCAERGLKLESAEGRVEMLASEDWNLQRLSVEFVGKLESGNPDEDDIGYIASRMKQCPVSKNIREVGESETRVRFDG